MLTVPEAARRAGKNPETIRRWIRSGKLRSRKIGTQHVIDEADLADAIEPASSVPLPADWRVTSTGEPMPDWVALVREVRAAR
jgi:excisionase family DNA binding protein